MSEALNTVQPSDSYREKIQGARPLFSRAQESALRQKELHKLGLQIDKKPDMEMNYRRIYETDFKDEKTWAEQSIAEKGLEIAGLIRAVLLKDFDALPKDRALAEEHKHKPIATEKALAFTDAIAQSFGGLAQIKKAQVSRGMMTLWVSVPPQAENTKYMINLTEVFKVSPQKWAPLIDTAPILSARNKPFNDELDTLKNNLETESYLGGAIVIKYERVQQAKSLINNTASTLWLMGVWAGAIDTAGNTIHRIQRVFFRNELGALEEVDRSVVKQFGSIALDRSKLSNLSFRIMAGVGKVYNRTRWVFTSYSLAGFDRAHAKLAALTPSELKIVDLQKFSAAKTELLAKFGTVTEKTLQATLLSLNGLAKVGGTTMHGLMMGIFFREYHKNSSDLFSFSQWIAEVWLFSAWAKAGSKMAPWLWKMPASMIAWGITVAAGMVFWGQLWLDKTAWRNFPGRESSSGKSFTGHVLSFGATHDLLDKTKSTDIRVPWTRGWFRVHNVFGRDTVAPDIAFYKTTLDFGTDPREFMTVGIRDTGLWNSRIDEFTKWSTSAILAVLSDYRAERGMFSSGNTTLYGLTEKENMQWVKTTHRNKDQALRERIAMIIAGSGEPEYSQWDTKNSTYKFTLRANHAHEAVVEDVIEYITGTVAPQTNVEQQKNMIEFILNNYGNVLKIDSHYIEHAKKTLEADKKNFDDFMGEYIDLLPPKSWDLARKVIERLIAGQQPISSVDRLMDVMEPKVISGGQTILTTKKVKTGLYTSDMAELRMYQSIIDDTTAMPDEWYEKFGMPIPKPPKSSSISDNSHLSMKLGTVGLSPVKWDTAFTLGDGFVAILNLAVAYKRQKDFLAEIERTWFGSKWKAF